MKIGPGAVAFPAVLIPDPKAGKHYVHAVGLHFSRIMIQQVPYSVCTPIRHVEEASNVKFC